MKPRELTENDLRRELADFRERFPKLNDNELFVLWFLRAFVTQDEEEAASALTGGSGDKGADAVFFDDGTKVVYVVQGKYRQRVGAKSEPRGEVMAFAHLALDLAGDEAAFRTFAERLAPQTLQRLATARRRVQERDYRLQLYYVTLGRCSAALRQEAKGVVRRAECSASLEIVSGAQVFVLLADYLDGVAPPVPSLDLEMESSSRLRVSGVLQRYDAKMGIESWVFSMRGESVADLYARAGPRLFARNVRGFLGLTEINRAMEATMKKEPEFFWYYNNGITIICDEAQRLSSGGRDVLRVSNPQLINGQQTARTLHAGGRPAEKSSVLVRVIRIPRDQHKNDHFDELVSRIVAATNWQNAIRPSDLMSNDRRQIELERRFRRLGYEYLRKRQTKSEARRAPGAQHRFLVTKAEIAQAVAACELDPAIVRAGKEGLFEEDYYPQVFPTGDPYFYLSRYWAMRASTEAARGYPERAYGKWLALHFLWSQVEPTVKSRTTAERFRLESERGGTAFRALVKLSHRLYREILRFYRKRRGKGATAIDVSTFFKRSALNAEFMGFWRSPLNRSRRSFRRGLKQFEEILSFE